MSITRRGFLSLCLSLPAIAKIPEQAEPIIKRATDGEILKIAANSLYGKIGNPNFKVERYSMSLGSMLVEPGQIAVLRGIPSTALKIQRLLLNNPGFGILHFGKSETPMLDGELESDLFTPVMPDRLGRLDFDWLYPTEELQLAVINHNNQTMPFAASVYGAAKVFETPDDS